MAVEIVAGRAIAPYVGMSLYSWTVIIAVVLAGLSIGHWIGGVLSDRAERPRVWVAATLGLAAASTWASLGVLRLLAPSLDGVDPLTHVGALTLAAFFAPSLFAGVLSPMLTKLALDAAAPERRGRVLGQFFALGSAGAIAGTLLAGLVLVSWIGSAWSMILIGAVYAALAPFFLAARIGAGVAAAAFIGLGLAVAGRAEFCDAESVYYCIQIDEAPVGGATAKVMALDHLAHGVSVQEDPALLVSPYLHGADELVRRRFTGPKLDAYFIGGGAYTLPRAWLTRFAKGRMVVAELDQAVTEMAHAQMWLQRDPRLEVFHDDARRALAARPPGERYDVIFGDAFHDISIPQHLVTDEFHVAIKNRLRPGGVYAINVVDLLRAPRFLLSFAHTLRRRFAAVELWIDVEEIQPTEKRTTWIVLASDEPTPFDQMRSRDKIPRAWVRVPLDAMLDTRPRDTLVTLTDDYSPVDRLLSAVLLTERAEE